MITAIHAIIYANRAEELRAFFRDVLELPSVDAGGGWLIFALPPAELAIHPADQDAHQLYLMCDDLDATIAELEAKGVEFSGKIARQSWGRVTSIRLPGGAEMGLYEPRHASPLDPSSG